MSEVKRCPWCRGIPDIRKHFKMEAWSMSHRCPVLGFIKLSDFTENLEPVIRKWNNRPESEAERVLRELYTAELQLCEYDFDDLIEADDPRYVKALEDYHESRRKFTDLARKLAGETTTEGAS